MKFFGKGYVWNPQANKMMCNFNEGPYETEDDYEIGILQASGFKSEFGDEIIVESVEVDDDALLDELKAVAKEHGLKGYGKIKDPDKLKEWIAERVD